MTRFVRSAMSAMALNVSAVVAHHLAGGHFIPTSTLLLLLVIVMSISLLNSRHEFEGPRLAAIIVFSQLFAHIFLGNSSTNSLNMLIGHTVSGVLTYLFIWKLDQAILWLDEYLFPLLINVFTLDPAKSKYLPDITRGQKSCTRIFAAVQYWSTSPPLVAMHT